MATEQNDRRTFKDTETSYAEKWLKMRQKLKMTTVKTSELSDCRRG